MRVVTHVADAASVGGHSHWQRLPREPHLVSDDATSLIPSTSLVPLTSRFQVSWVLSDRDEGNDSRGRHC
ncbi:MAG: hypothetical protein JWN70_1075 [Planctomycetaceae bacterium]|nr:hypothetical protein [Planctomycetaceae bacterium]